jgi:glycosyltransferase involved in cell wall biosynthesis
VVSSRDTEVQDDLEFPMPRNWSGPRSPEVSVCLPNLNNAAYLAERFECILAQTFRNYEVVVSDNYSNDGAWDIINHYVRKDCRIRAYQAPQNGMYANWNNCIRSARGQWVYIATSDDTMTPNCIERLHTAGERENLVDIVTSRPRVIKGEELKDCRENLRRCLYHRRRNEGIINPVAEFQFGLIGGTPTLSITQFLIRKTVFPQVGYFPTIYGSFGDYYWQMKALTRCSSWYVPEKLGAWRFHNGQATPHTDTAIRESRSMIASDLIKEGCFFHDIGTLLALSYCLSQSDKGDLTNLQPLGLLSGRIFRACQSVFGHSIHRHFVGMLVSTLSMGRSG